MHKPVIRGAAAFAAAMVLLAPGAAHADPVVLTITPQQAVIGPDAETVVTITVSERGEIPVYLTWHPAPPPGMASQQITRNGDKCSRDNTAHYRCDGRGPITITYPPITDETLDGATFQLAAKVDGGHRFYGTATVQFPAPEPSPTPEPSEEPSPDDPGPTGEQPTLEVTESPNPSVEPTPTPEPTESPSPESTPDPAESPEPEFLESPGARVLGATAVGMGFVMLLAAYRLIHRRLDPPPPPREPEGGFTITIDDERTP